MAVIRRTNTPEKIQDLVNSFSSNFELDGDTYWSPQKVLQARCGHCIEAALLALVICRYHNIEAGLINLQSVAADTDHVICAFRRRGRWGAIAKCNHAVLRYREPVYRSPRELVMSYFHEYRDDDGIITLRQYSRLVPYARLDRVHPGWEWAEEKLDDIALCLDEAPHYPILRRGQRTRRADPIERHTGNIVEWCRPYVRTKLPKIPRH